MIAATPPGAGSVAEKVLEIIALLRKEYGRHGTGINADPTASLVGTILSQHTADRNSHAAFAALQRRYGSWHEVAEAPAEELADVIRSAGLGNLKAARIQEALRTIEARFGTMDLEFLKSLPLAEAREILRSLPGVGPKTAACVLLFSCDLPALPVDTHVHRVSRRLGLIGPNDSAERAHEILETLVPVDDVYDFHVDLIAHGRQVCHARGPECGVCVLQGRCDYFRNGKMEKR